MHTKNSQSQQRLLVSCCVIYCNMFRRLYKAVIRQCRIQKKDYHMHHIRMFLFLAVYISAFTVLWVLLGTKIKYQQEIKYIEIH
jgi:hypothetical protein